MKKKVINYYVQIIVTEIILLRSVHSYWRFSGRSDNADYTFPKTATMKNEKSSPLQEQWYRVQDTHTQISRISLFLSLFISVQSMNNGARHINFGTERCFFKEYERPLE